MSAFRIIYALSTMFSLAYCSEYSFTIDMPTIMNSLSSMANQAWSSSQALISSRALRDLDSDADPEVEDPAAVGKLKKATMDAVGYMATILNSLSPRRTEVKPQEERKPQVEMGPGSYKSEQVSYPPHYFVDRLKTLLKIKKREEDKKKPLNKPEK